MPATSLDTTGPAEAGAAWARVRLGESPGGAEVSADLRWSLALVADPIAATTACADVVAQVQRHAGARVVVADPRGRWADRAHVDADSGAGLAALQAPEDIAAALDALGAHIDARRRAQARGRAVPPLLVVFDAVADLVRVVPDALTRGGAAHALGMGSSGDVASVAVYEGWGDAEAAHRLYPQVMAGRLPDGQWQAATGLGAADAVRPQAPGAWAVRERGPRARSWVAVAGVVPPPGVGTAPAARPAGRAEPGPVARVWPELGRHAERLAPA